MNPIILSNGLPFVSTKLYHNNKSLVLPHVLLDTGLARTILSADNLLKIGLKAELNDRIRYMTGIGGGVEGVLEKQIDRIELGTLSVTDFTIQMGGLNYGFPLDGIIGLDYLLAVKAQISSAALTIS